jgi:FkbM family methyltransferase
VLKRLKEFAAGVGNLGLANAVSYKVRKATTDRRPGVPFLLRSRYAAYPLSCRPRTSDVSVFHMIFVRREYACLDGLPGVRLVIDCGANVGYSAAYFLTRFPAARLVAVEPDPGNFAMLRHNLAPYGDRVTLVHSGVWSHRTGLVLSEEPFRDGREWSRQVREVRPGEAPDLQAVDLELLRRQAGGGRIDVLKIDVEGAEAEIFGADDLSWLDYVDHLVVELHDGRSREIFLRALAGRPFDLSRSFELTVCRRRAPAA